MDVMEQLVADLSCALEESKTAKGSRSWNKHRRSRSTSNLIPGAGAKTDSDESKDGNDSDEAERSLAKLSLQHRQSGSKYHHTKKMPMPNVVESDSFNELFNGPAQPVKVSQSRRRRRFKRMAVDVDREFSGNKNEESLGGLPSPKIEIPSTSKSATSLNNNNNLPCSSKSLLSKKSHPIIDYLGTGKRKRGGRERSVEALENENLLGPDEEMKSDDDEEGSSLSSADSDVVTCDEGQEGDDEHSDWVGDEFMEETDSERRRDLIIRKLRDYAPSREIRAGRRFVHPTKPVFSIKTSANEQLSKFLQDPQQSELKLHPMRKDERVQLGHLASLYSLQMRYLKEERSEKGFTCPILTKTSKTKKMDAITLDELDGTLKEIAVGPLWLESESDSKRVKK